tara:strand:- start:89 stop:766 length:678 start_codon:yes stop_codon:yes gene_type:complete
MLKKLLKHRYTLEVISHIAAFYIRLIWWTGSWKVENEAVLDPYFKQNKPFLVCFWHARLLMVCFGWPKKKPFNMLISASSDGQIIKKAIEKFSIKTIEGSSSRGAVKAFRTVLSKLSNDEIVGITPDGPRGPREKVQAGLLQAALLKKADIIPISYSARHHKRFKSWDKFFLPLLFTQGCVRWGTPVSPPATKEELAEKQNEVEAQLVALTTALDEEYAKRDSAL